MFAVYPPPLPIAQKPKMASALRLARKGNNVGKIMLFVILGAFLISCTGDRGPAGPAGTEGLVGPEGPPGATIIYITGSVSVGDYSGQWIAILDVAIRDSAVTQVFITPEQTTIAWVSVDYQFAPGVVYIYDPTQDYIGWDFLIMIIPNAGG